MVVDLAIRILRPFVNVHHTLDLLRRVEHVEQRLNAVDIVHGQFCGPVRWEDLNQPLPPCSDQRLS
jgi:hypothetical protein